MTTKYVASELNAAVREPKNGRALDDVRRAFDSGYAAARRGVSRNACYLKSPVLMTAWLRGFDNFKFKQKGKQNGTT